MMRKKASVLTYWSYMFRVVAAAARRWTDERRATDPYNCAYDRAGELHSVGSTPWGMEATLKNILLLLHDDAGQEARLQAALDIVRAMEGHLTCLDVSLMPAMAGSYATAQAEAMLLEDERAREAANRERIEARLAHEDVPWNWLDATGSFASCLTDAAGLADLIVVNRKLDGFPVPDMRVAAGELIVKSRRPILAVPDETNGFAVAGRALIAWDGSPAAIAAMRAAIPLLQKADAVILFEVDDGSLQTSGEQAATYLSRYGVHVLVRREKAGGRVAGELILQEARDRRSDYLVMGGFGHRRFVEVLFGGVTRKLLTGCPIPLFIAH